MNAAAHAARAVLWEWIGEVDDPDIDQRHWKRSRIDGILLACERTGVLADDELASWRALARGDQPAAASPSDGARLADHLNGLLDALRPLSRDEDLDRLRSSGRFRGALGALAAAGVLDDAERSRWHERALSAEAPWLATEDVAQLVGGSGFFAIGVPARTPEEEAADAADRLAFEHLTRRGALRTVALTPDPPRHDGLAVLGVITRTECTEVLFHFVGPPHGDAAGGFADLDAGSELIDALVPPDLTDAVGTSYVAVAPRPVHTSGTGGMPDPERPRVMTGAWRYQPAAPDDAGTFVATLGDARWVVG